MAKGLREIKRRRSSVQSTKKITRAFELIAAAQVRKAQQAMAASLPYANAITAALSELASSGSELSSGYLSERAERRNAAVIVVTSDRGLAGPYSSSILKETEELITRLRDEGVTPKLYVTGRKGVAYFKFRNRDIEQSWVGYSDKPKYVDAKEVANVVIDAFQDGEVDEIFAVYAHFVSSISQRPVVRRFLPLEVVEETEELDGVPEPVYNFEPDADTVLRALLPRYVEVRLFAAFLEASASELSARRRAMSTATDNATELIEDLTRQYNQARQAAITQELTELVGAAEASAGS